MPLSSLSLTSIFPCQHIPDGSEARENAGQEGLERFCSLGLRAYSLRHVGFVVQRPSDWQDLVGLPSSMKPGRQAYLTTEPTHQSLPYTTPL